MDSFGRASVVFGNGQTREFDKVELLDSGVLKALQIARSDTPTVYPVGSTAYKVSYFSPQAWAEMHPVSTDWIADDPGFGKTAPPPKPPQ
ncbi:hypothetical protein MOKP64_50980 [Mycobacterium avium subsp. hominissuis]